MLSTFSKNWRYLRYLTRHKWHAFIECWRLGEPWLGIIHDLSKFRPDEWGPYAEWFYGTRDAASELAYHKATFLHHRRNAHHWIYWVAVNHHNVGHPWPMPDKYRREMLADWIAGGKASGSKWTTCYWFQRQRGQMRLHFETERWIVEQLMKMEGK